MSTTEHTFAGPSTPPIPVKGFDAAGIHCGIKPTGALDLALIASPAACRAAAVFTQNAFPAAPVLYDRDLLRMNPDGTHGVVINSGNANACTSAEGNANARRMAEAAGEEPGKHRQYCVRDEHRRDRCSNADRGYRGGHPEGCSKLAPGRLAGSGRGDHDDGCVS